MSSCACGTGREPPAPRRGPRPSELRAALFGDAAARATSVSVAEIVANTATRLDLTPEELGARLFSDLPGERPVHAPTPLPTTADIALHTNLAIAQAVLMRASEVFLNVEGGVRPIVRLAKLRGLLCTITELPHAPRPTLEISGPFSLFRHTLVYGRALAELVPHLAWCARFDLTAVCALRGRMARVSIESGDPIFPAAAPAAYDSQLEERFARDVTRLAPDWDVIREPEPLRAGASLIFPDFLLRHRIHPERRALVEIVGFWTPQYLATKLAKLREANADMGDATSTSPAFLLCIDEQRGCAPSELPPGMPVVTFRRRIDAAAVMREVERLTASATPEPARSSG